MLNRNYKLSLEQEKWYRNISEGTIKVQKELFTIQMTENKRKILYTTFTKKDQGGNNFPVGTEPFNLTS